MVQGAEECAYVGGIVEDVGGEAARTLSILWHQRELSRIIPVLPQCVTYSVQVAEPSQSEKILQLGAIHALCEEISVAETVHSAPALQAVNREVSSIEEPDVGNLQVRFREGH